VVLDAVAYRKFQGPDRANAEMLPIPDKPGHAGIVTADDVRASCRRKASREISAGDCVALHTGQATAGATTATRR
jgi:hypothetical protein